MKLLQILLLFVLAGLLLFGYWGRSLWFPLYLQVMGSRTTDQVIQTLGVPAEQRLKADFASVGVAYPPEKINLIAIKDTNIMELWAQQDGLSKKIKTYRIQAASGVLGPKLREGDFQVPEGIYQINAFNPNSSYHLSLKLNYPNAFDLKYANAEGRTEPGSNIFIHGKAVSIGCLAMGDVAIEELFTLVHKVSRPNVTVVIAPKDPAIAELSVPVGSSDWVGELYKEITVKIKQIRG